MNNLSNLKESRCGQPPLRHGLNLLWWFAHKCVQIDSNGRMIPQCNPENGDFGFCLFHKRERLLPHSNLYYEVGNLNKTDSLPDYVTEEYTGRLDDSNIDRIIVSFDSRRDRFGRIYVTKHSDKEIKRFDQNHTYRIKIKLMKNIKDLSREKFLRDPILPNPLMNPPENVSIDMFNGGHSQARPSSTPPQPVPEQSETCLNKKYCCLLMCVIVPLLIIAAIVFS